MKSCKLIVIVALFLLHFQSSTTWAEMVFDESYFPMEVGNYWKYSGHFGNSQTTFYQNVTGLKTWGGYSSYIFSSTWGQGSPIQMYYAYVKDPFEGVAQTGAQGGFGSSVFTPPNIRHFGISIGAEYLGESREEFRTPSGTLDYVSLKHYKVKRKNDDHIIVAAGAFDCVVLEYTESADYIDGRRFLDPSTHTYYYAPGVGIIKVEGQTTHWGIELEAARIGITIWPRDPNQPPILGGSFLLK